MSFSIFVSYSHEDADLVAPVVRLLRVSQDLAVQDADCIRPGKKGRQEITEALQTAKLVLVFWCKHSDQSMEVKSEYTAAIAAGKDLAPILLDSTPVPHDLGQFQWIDFRSLAWYPHKRIESQPSLRPPPGLQGLILALLTGFTLVSLILVPLRWGEITAHRIGRWVGIGWAGLALGLLMRFIGEFSPWRPYQDIRKRPWFRLHQRAMAALLQKELMRRLRANTR